MPKELQRGLFSSIQRTWYACGMNTGETEWTELIDISVNRLSAPTELNGAFESMKVNECDFSKKLYGNGNSGKIIVDSIMEYFI